MLKIAIATPIGIETGGPEALHQLCDMIRKFGHNAYLLPWEGSENNKPVENYEKYDAPIDFSLEKDTILIVPETVPELILKTKKAIIWWLSVDNSPLFKFTHEFDISELNPKTEIGTSPFWQKFYSHEVAHYSQSQYARDFLNKKFNIESSMLTDYINEDDLKINNDVEKELISFSFKGSKHYEFFADNLSEFNCIRINGMTKQQVMETLAKSRIYVDLGHQPGRDRMPREAALNDTFVMVNKMGAGGVYLDAPLPNEFKFDLSEKAFALKKIKNALQNHFDYSESQLLYKNWVSSQKEVFEFEVWRLLKNL